LNKSLAVPDFADVCATGPNLCCKDEEVTDDVKIRRVGGVKENKKKTKEKTKEKDKKKKAKAKKKKKKEDEEDEEEDEEEEGSELESAPANDMER
jgi:hypothetical protein